MSHFVSSLLVVFALQEVGGRVEVLWRAACEASCSNGYVQKMSLEKARVDSYFKTCYRRDVRTRSKSTSAMLPCIKTYIAVLGRLPGGGDLPRKFRRPNLGSAKKTDLPHQISIMENINRVLGILGRRSMTHRKPPTESPIHTNSNQARCIKTVEG